MTYETHVFIDEKDLPTACQWTEVISHGTYDLSITPFEMPGHDAHFIPCKIENRASGFDLKIEQADFEDYNLNQQQRAQIDGRNLVASFRTYSDSQEIAAMVVASGLFAESFDGIIVSELEEELVLPGHIIAYIDQHLTNCRKQFDGQYDMRKPYNPKDPTANTIPEDNPWMGFALFAIIAIFMLVIGVLNRMKTLLSQPKRHSLPKPPVQATDGDDEDLASRR